MAALYNHLLSLTLAIPAIGAAAVLLVARDTRASRARSIALASTVVSGTSAVFLWTRYDPDGKTWQFAERFTWAPRIGLSLYLGVDGTSILLLLLASLVAVVAVVASWNHVPTRGPAFYAALLAAEAGMLGVFMALDLLMLFVCWATVLVSIHRLVRQGSENGPRVAARFLYGGSAVGLLFLAGMVALYLANPGDTSAYSSDITLLQTRTLPPALQTWVFVAFTIACAATASLFPLHPWIVAAQSAAPTAGSLLIAAVLTKMGLYGLFRLVLPIVPDASRQFGPLVAWIAIAAMCGGAILAWRQTDLKRLIAYATASHVAVMMLGLFTFTPAGLAGSVVQQLGHGIWIAGLCVCAAIAYDRTGLREIRGLDGLGKENLVLAALFCIIVLAGIRMSSPLGLVGDAWGLRGGVAVNRGWPLASLASIVLTLAYIVPVVRRVVRGEFSTLTHTPSRLSVRESIVLVSLSALSVVVSVHPRPLVDLIEPSVSRVVVRIHPELAPYLRLGSDCPTAAPPDPAGPPPGFILIQPCAEEQPASPKR